MSELELTELCRQARLLAVRVRRCVRTSLAGSYASAFKGPGLDFEDFAPYRAGDDVRHIAWHVTARRREPYIKRYVEERQLRLIIALDVSASMLTPALVPGLPRKCDSAGFATAALALAAALNRDRVGAVTFSADVKQIMPPRPGEKHALQIVRRALSDFGTGGVTDLRPMLRYTLNLRRHMVVVVLSDFFSQPPPWDASVQRLLAANALKHEMLAVQFAEWPVGLPAAGAFVHCRDPESGCSFQLDLSATGAKDLIQALEQHRMATSEALAKCGILFVDVRPADDCGTRLRLLLARRSNRLSGSGGGFC